MGWKKDISILPFCCLLFLELKIADIYWAFLCAKHCYKYLRVLTHLFFKTSLWNFNSSYPPFTSEKTEVERSVVTSRWSHREYFAESSFEQASGFRVWTLSDQIISPLRGGDSSSNSCKYPSSSYSSSRGIGKLHPKLWEPPERLCDGRFREYRDDYRIHSIVYPKYSWKCYTAVPLWWYNSVTNFISHL